VSKDENIFSRGKLLFGPEKYYGANTNDSAPNAKTVEVPVFANTNDSALDAKTVEVPVFANTDGDAPNAKTVEVPVFANTNDSALDAKTVEVPVFVNTDGDAPNAKTVEVPVFANTDDSAPNAKTVVQQNYNMNDSAMSVARRRPSEENMAHLVSVPNATNQFQSASSIK